MSTSVVKRAFDSAFGSPEHSSPFRVPGTPGAHYVPHVATDIETDDDAATSAATTTTMTLPPVAVAKRSRFLLPAEPLAAAAAATPPRISVPRPDSPFRAAGARRTMGELLTGQKNRFF